MDDFMRPGKGCIVQKLRDIVMEEEVLGYAVPLSDLAGEIIRCAVVDQQFGDGFGRLCPEAGAKGGSRHQKSE